MKKLLPGVLLVFSTLALFGGPRDAEWQKVRDATAHGLPRTAITNLEPIIAAALKDKAYAEAVKAIGEKISLEGAVEGNKPEEKITRLQTEIARAPKEMTPVLEALLADWYWQYFQENNWRFLNRTATAAAPGKDFTTWDLPRLFAEIDRHFANALAADRTLKAVPVATWNDLLVKGTMPDSYRPTLYDFIAHEALEFYTAGEQAAARPEDAFELEAASPIFDSPEKFIAWRAGQGNATGGSTNDPSLVLKAIRLYQDLLRFHQNDAAPQIAFAAADLERLTWGWNTAVGEDKAARYQAALETFIAVNSDSDIYALGLEREAQVLQQTGDLVGAHKLAARGVQRFPDSPGGKLCHNLILQIEARSASISTERVWNCFAGQSASAAERGPCSAITVHYRNVDTVYFRAIPYDWEIFLQKRYNRPESLTPDERHSILRAKPAFEWSEKLPPTTNYTERTLETPAPDKLKPGFYFIAASHDPGFGEQENQVSMAPVWVSDLALITRERNGLIEGFVLEAGSGEPVAGAQISVWHLDNSGDRVADPSLTTDENGLFSLKPSRNRGDYLFRARHQGRELATTGGFWGFGSQEPSNPRPEARTMFFTDRAIYRPGQTILYKGICLWVDQAKDNYEVLKGEELTVVFKDSNGKEIERWRHRANDYGSFAGSFTAPRDRLLGQMSIEIDGRAQGQTSVRVEEYKRPKFQVKLDAPKTGAKLNEKVSLTGHAMNYTGAAVDGAQVKFHVVREVRMPWWCWWWRPNPQNENQEIAHGTAHTETDGSFHIEFVARPDLKVPEKDEPIFEFKVNADVTDSAGETRSDDHVIRVGYTALEASLRADDWQTVEKAVELNVEAKTLDGEPQVAAGSVEVCDLRQPDQAHRPGLSSMPYGRYRGSWAGGIPNGGADTNDLSNPNNWPLGKVVAESKFETDTNGAAKLSFQLGAGIYRVLLETKDRFGKKVTGRLPLQVLKPDDTRLAVRIPHLLAAPDWEVQPGQDFMALWGTGYESGRAFIEIEHRHKLIQRYWTKPGQTQQQIKLAITEEMRGGFTLHVTQVRENRDSSESRHVSVPWKNKELELKWDHFVSKLQPGRKETWSLEISGLKSKTGQAEKSAAELVAALYDESLDAFVKHDWPQRFGIFREDDSDATSQFGNTEMEFQYVLGRWDRDMQSVVISYRSFPSDLKGNWWGVRNRRFFNTFSGGFGGVSSLPAGGGMEGAFKRSARGEQMVVTAAPAMPAATTANASMPPAMDSLAILGDVPLSGAHPSPPPPHLDLGQVTARKNLNETAFFYPQLTSDTNGVVRMTFTMPEALTKWRFLGFAHDRSVRSGFLEAHAVTAKDLMIQPNPPRFLREGDIVEFAVKVSNQSDTRQTGTVRLTFTQAANDQSADQLLDVQPAGQGKRASGMPGTEQNFDIPAKESRSFAWRITVPDGCGYLTYKAVGATTSVSDGEEGAVPVLSRRILVTESLPLPIRGPATKKFEFTKLLKSGGSKTLQNESLTVQMVSHPAWYAVLALPYLMEFPHECSEQVFNRYYANVLARHIANSDPKIRRIFDQWKNTPALDSPLEKNQDLKAVMIEETPWLRQAQSESRARRNVGILFDANRLNYETDATLRKLADMQLGDGSWPWFPGGHGNDYITLYITTGFGRLRHLGADVDIQPALRSLQRLDAWMTEEYAQIQRGDHPEDYVPSSTDALYLYGRSFFLKDLAINSRHRKAIDFFLGQARKFWLQTGCRQTQGHLAIGLKRFGALEDKPDPTPAAIMASLRERSVSNEELGRFWRDTELSWWWYRAPIETQALMIEAFDEVAGDQTTVEECRVWLLKQKQTQDWKTTKATADAIYALLLRGKNILSSDALVEVKLDGVDVTPKSNRREAESPRGSPTVEPGTGFYEYRFAPPDIKPKLGEITVKKVDEGVAWGSVHWQYLEDMTRVTPYEGTPLKLKKTLYTKIDTAKGKVLEPVKGPLKVGDELVVRLELRVDRDMEYVHLKDQRGSGTEPVNVLSQYRYQDGLAYYESTRDTASHFFIDYLPKGTYVFEYSTRVQLRGEYQTGIAQIQCMYAPEFDSHSESIPLVVK